MKSKPINRDFSLRFSLPIIDASYSQLRVHHPSQPDDNRATDVAHLRLHVQSWSATYTADGSSDR